MVVGALVCASCFVLAIEVALCESGCPGDAVGTLIAIGAVAGAIAMIAGLVVIVAAASRRL